MKTHIESHPHRMSIVAVVIGGVALVAAIVYAVLPMGVIATLAPAVLGVVAVVLGVLAYSRNTPRSVSVVAILAGVAAILVIIAVLLGTVPATTMGGGGYTY